MSSDTIGNMLSTIKNASMVGNEYVEISHSGIKEDIAKILKENGFVKDMKVFKEKGQNYKMIRLDLNYDENYLPAITSIKRISKPGKRVYRSYSELRSVSGGLGFFVISTSRGLMTSDDAKKKKLGGEVICEIF